MSNRPDGFHTLAYAQSLDAADTLQHFRKEFHLPQHNDRDAIYLCGNSLGLQPKNARAYVEDELKDWEKLGVEGHMHGKNPLVLLSSFFRNICCRTGRRIAAGSGGDEHTDR
jgi:kynureninase